MRVIDSHTHCFPDDLAERAICRLVSGYHVTPSFDGTIKGLIAQMDAVGIEASVVVPVATKESQVKPINDWAAGIRHPRVIPFGAVHPDLADLADEMARIKGLGLRGVKIHPNWQQFKPQDPAVFPMYEALVANDLIAYFHGGDELEKWPEPIVATPFAFSEVHRQFPNMRMVVAHMGGYLMWDEVEEYLIGKDVYFDVSACFPEYLPDERLLPMMRAHGMEKILWASDSPCSDPLSQLNRILSLPLTDEEKEMICWRNAVRLLGLE